MAQERNPSDIADFGGMEMDAASSAENFSLQHFVQSTGSTLLERVKPFSDYLGETTGRGYALYAREIIGATGPSVQVKDSITGLCRKMVMMGSNNYLGLANHPRVKKAVQDAVEQYGVGMGGPPLLNGMSSLHRRLEVALAQLKGKEDALIYASGFQANLGWVTAVLRQGDVLIADEFHHASLFDGLRLARATQRVQPRVFRHNDMDQLSKVLKYSKKKLAAGAHIFVAVEGVYSMDGDLAPLPDIVKLCRECGATLAVDDAHGTGILGKQGGGTAEHFGVSDDVDLAMGTFSKTFGVTGGFIAGKREVIDYLRYFSRSYMFSAHLPQTIAAAVLAGIELIRNDPSLRQALQNNVQTMVQGMTALGYKVKSESAIIPVLLPPDIDIRKIGRRFHEEGLFCNMIEPPAVAVRDQRVRLSIMADHSAEDLAFALDVLRKLGQEFGML
ncbi:MAG: pyridoxal phosphate-dependent aminotransferase family protein [Deltaproteobacteria bacterium]|nr:pyridoxal phosphate-dependent aminotransferase family protein [Deltaproteobacteria bacterium]